MSQGRNDEEKSLQKFTMGIAKKVMECTQKTLSLCSSGCIYKVPECLRKQKESAYTPRVIAIGPLHQKDEHLQTPMRRVKWYYTHHLLNRLTKGIEDDNLKPQKIFEVLQQCAKKMKEKECVDEAKKYYAVEVTVDDEKMSEMMLVDGCFILELLYASHRDKKSKEAAKMTTNGVDSGINLKALSSIPQPNGGEGSSGVKQLSDPFFDSVFNRNIVKQDLVLLENQIPFFVLEELFKLTVAKIPEDPDGNELSLTDYVLSYFGDIFRSEGTNSEGENSGSKMNTSCGSPSDFAISASGSTKEMEKSEGENSGSKTKTSCPPPSDCAIWVCGSTKESKPTKEEPGKANHYYHILHLLHERYPQPTGGKNVTEFQVSASDLHYAGVKFVSRKENNLFDITFIEPEGICWWFHRAKFEIPTLNIHDATGTFLGNLIALELCSPGVRPHFMSYANFMDTLIDSKEDVKVLKEAKVIRNHLGEDADVAELFNKLCKDVVVGEFYFNDKYHDAYKYSKHWYPNLMAHCKRKYFSPPWAFGAVIVAIIAFGMGVTQFVRSFLT